MSDASHAINRRRDANQDWVLRVMRAAHQVAEDEGLPRRPSVVALRQLFEEVGDE